VTTTTDELQGRTIEVGGLATHVVDAGEGHPLVLVHGAGPATRVRFSFGTVLADLAGRYRVVAADMPGYGGSASLPVDDTPANVADHVLALMDALDVPRAAVLGHSRGGRIATELAAAAPDRVSHLVVVCSGSTAPGGHRTESGGFTDAARAIVSFGVGGDTSFEAFAAARRGTMYDPGSLSDAMLREAYDEMISTGQLERYMRQMERNDPLNFYHQQDAAAFLDKLRGLAVPVCVVWGREDAVAPLDRALGLVDVVPDVEFHVLSRCGHSPMIEQREAFLDLVTSFLARRR
jgi:pimeloyl-ACP methyl ester carboxylesterase